jgi:chromosomal replication initiation ATPase DnaA
MELIEGDEPDTVRLALPSAFATNWVRSHYADRLHLEFKAVLPEVRSVVIETRAPSKVARLTSVETRCDYDPNATDITVCGRRNADRFRIPFEVPPEPGDPRHEGVMEERTRLLARTTPVKDLSPFQVGGGFAGVAMDTNAKGSGGKPTLRKPAP